MPNLAGIEDHNGSNAEKLAEGYKTIERQTVYPELYRIAQDASAKGKVLHILDIGSGAGNDAIELAKLNHKVVGIEPSDLREIDIRNHSHVIIDYRNDTLPSLRSIKEGEKFDLVLLSAVWQYIDPTERVASLVKIAEVMKPTGKLIVSYPSPPSRPDQFEISAETLKADIAKANASLPKHQQFAMNGELKVIPDTRGRKSLDGKRDLTFHTATLETGHAQSMRKSLDRPPAHDNMPHL